MIVWISVFITFSHITTSKFKHQSHNNIYIYIYIYIYCITFNI